MIQTIFFAALSFFLIISFYLPFCTLYKGELKMFDQGIAHHLRNDNVLWLRQNNRSGVLGNIKSAQYKALLHEHQTYIEKSVLLLPEIGQLSHYLQNVPELAWDIVEYAEKSLEVIYQQPRNIPEYFLRQDQLSIRIYKTGPFHKFLFNQKHPIVLTLVSDNFPTTEFLKQHEKMLNLPDNYEWKMKADKVMSLGLNGEIKFY